jgi:hypothetical protein
MWTDLTQKRIDAVYRLPHQITIVEITRLAGMKAVGQLTTYPTLYQITYFPLVPIKTLLVCEKVLPDIIPVLDAKGLSYVILPDPENKSNDFPEV